MTNLKEQARAFLAKESYNEGFQHSTAPLLAAFAEQQLAEKEKEVERLRTALEKYANKRNWIERDFNESGLATSVQVFRWTNGADIARKALDHPPEGTT